MIEEELIKIWQSSPQQEQVKFEKSRLILDVQSNVDRFHKAMKWLYLREAASAIIIIPIFLIYAFVFPYPLTKIASILIVLWAIYILFVIHNTKKKKPEEYSANYLEYLIQTRSYLELQKKLRANIMYWYVLPFLSFAFLFLLGFFIGKSDNTKSILVSAAFCLVLGIIIYYLNQLSNKQVIEPKLNKVNELIKALEE